MQDISKKPRYISEQRNASALACLDSLAVPYRDLNLAEMCLLQYQHTQPRLSDTAADGQRKLIREQHAVICKTAAIVGSELAELSVKRLRIDTYTH